MSGTNESYTFFNGKIFTSNPQQPYADTMIVSDGKITWIGDYSEIEKIGGNPIDLGGRRVLPGFIDAHLHPLWLANAEKQISCMAPLVHSIEDIIEQIQKQCQSVDAGEWIEGWGYDEGKLSEKRTPTRLDLDKATNDIPVYLVRTCSHIAVVNSKALELAGITKDTPSPSGGEIDKDSNGEPTGVLRESAKNLVTRIMPKRTLEENAVNLAELSPKLLAQGITTITELMAETKPIDYFDLYKVAHKKGLKQRAVLYYVWNDLEKDQLIDARKLNRENLLHVGGVKLFSDGSISGQTAWVNPPFLGKPVNYGISTTSEEELLVAAEVAKKNQIQLVVHAMGEQSIDLIVNTFYGKTGWLTDGPSIRIEHAAMPTKQAIQRAAETGIVFVTQPIFLYAEIESYLNNLGAERTKRTYPIQSMLDSGIRVAFSSDAPGTAWANPSNPFVGIKAAVTRVAYDGTDIGQEQRVDVETALMLYTKSAQEVTRIPNIGQLKAGYQADFIVLDQDIFEMNIDKIDEIQVEETYIGGQLVYH